MLNGYVNRMRRELSRQGLRYHDEPPLSRAVGWLIAVLVAMGLVGGLLLAHYFPVVVR